MRIGKNKNQLLIFILVVGFLIGIVYENIFSGRDVATNELFLKSNLQNKIFCKTAVKNCRFLLRFFTLYATMKKRS